jgi:hypothetical protein
MVSAVYWVLIPDELADAGLTWPDGMRITGPPQPDRPWYPGAQWYLVEDDHAPAELDGRRVELTFRIEDRIPVVAGRDVLP